MNDLIIPSEYQRKYPTYTADVIKAFHAFDQIRSFADIERIFFLGQGLSKTTYSRYLKIAEKFYNYTGGMHPLMVTPGHIEKFYDIQSLPHEIISLRTGKTMKYTAADRNTLYLSMQGLKKYFAGIERVFPFYKSPFTKMEAKLLKKLAKKKNGNRTKKALTPIEVKDLLAWMSRDQTIKGMEDYAITYMMMTSGLRADELCQLKWKNIDMLEGQFTANFIGKGGKEAEQELYGLAVDSCVRYYKKAFHRDPRPEDALFSTITSKPRPLVYHTLLHRVKEVGARAREQGVITRELHFTPHLFRRTYATVLYKSGMKLKAIMEKTRHANIEVLAKHYISDDEPAAPYFDKLFV